MPGGSTTGSIRKPSNICGTPSAGSWTSPDSTRHPLGAPKHTGIGAVMAAIEEEQSAPAYRRRSIQLGPAGGRYAAELIGTFALVFAGPGAAVIDAYTHGGGTPVGIGLTFGLIVGVMIYS